jgi:hypothetical protein
MLLPSLSSRPPRFTPSVISLCNSPGVVTTDMTRAAAADMGAKLEDFGPITTEESAAGILVVVDAATKESHGGKFWSYDGSRLTY